MLSFTRTSVNHPLLIGCLLVLLLSWPLAGWAQTGAVRGTLLDAATNQPLPFANVVLLRTQDSSFVAGVQTAESGVFALEKLVPGTYTMQATVIGYRSGRRVLTLTAAAPVVQLGVLRLRPTATQLKEVTVEGERAPVTANLDKKVVNVAKDLTAVGGTATDVLQNVPSITVDQGGSVSLRGSGSVTIFIDGKPTGAAGGGQSTSLDQIPASSIESIEVITNPSSRYDAEGSAGIINIVLKKERKDGLNGLASVNVGTKDKYNTSLSLNYHQGKWNLFGSYDFRQDRRTGYGSLRQTTEDDLRDPITDQPTGETRTLDLTQSRSGVNYNTSHAVRLGADYSFTPTQTLTFSMQPRYNEQSSIEDILSRQVDRSDNDTLIYLGTNNRYNTSRGNTRTADISLDYRHTWTEHKGRELTANVLYTPISSENDLNSNLYYLLDGQSPTQRQSFRDRVDQRSAQVDYVRPFGEKGRLETGAKSVWRHYDTNYQFRSSEELIFDPSNRFLYKEYVQAAYATYANAAGKFSYQGGLRAEQTNTRGDQRATGKKFTRSYLNLFPSAVLAYDLAEEQRLQLAYSRRVNRPDDDDLNPFTDRSDPLNLSTGNPLLLPEYIHLVELGHQKTFGKSTTLSSTAFYSVETQTIKRLREVVRDSLTGNQVTNTREVNLGDEINYGLELVGATELTSIWKINANGSAFRRIIKSSGPQTEINNSNFVYTARINSTVSPTKKLDVQVSLNYRSPVVTAQGRRQTSFNTDIAAKHSVLKDRGSISLRVSDIFNTQRFNFTAFGPGLESVSRNKRETRIAFLGFSYRFGQNGAENKNQRRPEVDSDSNGGFEQ